MRAAPRGLSGKLGQRWENWAVALGWAEGKEELMGWLTGPRAGESRVGLGRIGTGLKAGFGPVWVLLFLWFSFSFSFANELKSN